MLYSQSTSADAPYDSVIATGAAATRHAPARGAATHHRVRQRGTLTGRHQAPRMLPPARGGLTSEDSLVSERLPDLKARLAEIQAFAANFMPNEDSDDPEEITVRHRRPAALANNKTRRKARSASEMNRKQRQTTTIGKSMKSTDGDQLSMRKVQDLLNQYMMDKQLNEPTAPQWQEEQGTAEAALAKSQPSRPAKMGATARGQSGTRLQQKQALTTPKVSPQRDSASVSPHNDSGEGEDLRSQRRLQNSCVGDTTSNTQVSHKSNDTDTVHKRNIVLNTIVERQQRKLQRLHGELQMTKEALQKITTSASESALVPACAESTCNSGDMRPEHCGGVQVTARTDNVCCSATSLRQPPGEHLPGTIHPGTIHPGTIPSGTIQQQGTQACVSSVLCGAPTQCTAGSVCSASHYSVSAATADCQAVNSRCQLLESTLDTYVAKLNHLESQLSRLRVTHPPAPAASAPTSACSSSVFGGPALSEPFPCILRSTETHLQQVTEQLLVEQGRCTRLQRQLSEQSGRAQTSEEQCVELRARLADQEACVAQLKVEAAEKCELERRLRALEEELSRCRVQLVHVQAEYGRVQTCAEEAVAQSRQSEQRAQSLEQQLRQNTDTTRMLENYIAFLKNSYYRTFGSVVGDNSSVAESHACVGDTVGYTTRPPRSVVSETLQAAI